MKRVLLTCLLFGSMSLTACQKDPYKASTYIPQLKSAETKEMAVTKLQQFGDPVAIKPLGELWEKDAHPPQLLQVIIGLARPLTPEQAALAYARDFEKTGRAEHWKDALPYLIKAVSEVDEANQRSLDSASHAANAIGESNLVEGLDALIEFANRAPSKKMLDSQRGAIRSIGKFGANNRAKAVAALSTLVEREAPEHPKTAQDPASKKALAEKFEQYLLVTSAAIDALGDLRTPEASKVLLAALYRTPELFTKVRRALVASGQGVEAELRRVIRGEHAEINAVIAAKRLDKYCGDRNELPVDQCKPVSAREYYASVVLGDFYNPAAVPDLLTVLKQPAAPAYVYNGAPGPSQHNAVFDALRKIGSPAGAAELRAIWSDSKQPPDVRTFAMSSYAFAARDGAGADELVKLADDPNVDKDPQIANAIRSEAATAYARVGVSAAGLGALERLADRNGKEADENQAKADAAKKGYDAVKLEFEAASKAFTAAKTAALAVTRDPKANAAAITAGTEKAGAAEDAFQAAKAKEKEAGAKYTPFMQLAKQLRQTQRMFQTHIARLEVAIRCKNDVACYSKTLTQSPDDVAANVKAYIKDIAKWTPEEKKLLVPAQIERAMLELGKRGQQASEFTNLLLDSVKSDDRIIRQSILLALPKIAKVPCDKCEDKLQEAIKAGEGKSTLNDLNIETQMLRNYFSWAGGKTPVTAPAATEKAPAK